MNNEQISKLVCETIERRAVREKDDYNIEIIDRIKEGVSRKTVRVIPLAKHDGYTASPLVDVDDIILNYTNLAKRLQHDTMDSELVSRTANYAIDFLIENIRDGIEVIEVAKCMFDNVKSNLRVKLFSKESDAKNNAVYTDYLDMVAVCYLEYVDGDDTLHSTRVLKEMIGSVVKLSEEEVIETALENTKQSDDYTIATITDMIMGSIMSNNCDPVCEKTYIASEPLIVTSNAVTTGRSAFFNMELLDRVATATGDDLVLFAPVTNETLIVSKTMCDEMGDDTWFDNIDELYEDATPLSNSKYLYNRVTKELTIEQ